MSSVLNGSCLPILHQEMTLLRLNIERLNELRKQAEISAQHFSSTSLSFCPFLSSSHIDYIQYLPNNTHTKSKLVIESCAIFVIKVFCPAAKGQVNDNESLVKLLMGHFTVHWSYRLAIIHHPLNIHYF